MDTLKEYSAYYTPLIDAEISAFFAQEHLQNTSAAFIYPLLEEFCLRPGKRIRPLLCLLGVSAYGTQIDPPILRIAAVIEILHAYLLIHDDIVDRAGMRRGGNSFHRVLDGVLGEHDGDAGAHSALVAGDMLLFDCLQYITSPVCAPFVGASFMHLLSECYSRTCAGQCVDLIASYSSTVGDMEQAMEIASLKTAYYTMISPFRMGAFLAGADDADTSEKIETALYPLGISFQLRDDVQGTFGHTIDTGKSDTSDLAESKNTLLVAAALSVMNQIDKERFCAIFTQGDKSPEEIRTLRVLLKNTGVEKIIREWMAGYYNTYYDALLRREITESTLKILDDIAQHLCTV